MTLLCRLAVGSTTMRLFLIRHGQTDWNVQERAQGGADRPLDETGILQKEALAQAFAEIPLCRVLTSDLSRSLETARAISERMDAELVILPALRERHFGTMEGQTYAELRTFFNRESCGDDTRRNRVRPPGGESFSDLWIRLESALPIVLAGPPTQAIVSHGGTSSLLCAMLQGETLDDTYKYRFHNASITELEIRSGSGVNVVRFDDIGHLGALPLLVRRGDIAAK